jgi:hypothetical protein
MHVLLKRDPPHADEDTRGARRKNARRVFDARGWFEAQLVKPGSAPGAAQSANNEVFSKDDAHRRTRWALHSRARHALALPMGLDGIGYGDQRHAMAIMPSLPATLLATHLTPTLRLAPTFHWSVTHGRLTGVIAVIEASG